jgi:hypothetical protein
MAMAAGPGDEKPPILKHRPKKKLLHHKGFEGYGGQAFSGGGDSSPSGNGDGGNPDEHKGNHFDGGNPPNGNPPNGNPNGNPPAGGPPAGPTYHDDEGGGGYIPIGGSGGDRSVPEIDPGSGMSALALLSGAVLVIRGRRKKS